MPSNPRLLFLCQTLPFPLDSGVAIRTYNILRLLAESFQITALCFYRRKHGTTPEQIKRAILELSKHAAVEAFPIPQEQSRRRLVWDHVRSTLLRRAYTVYAYESAAFASRLGDLLSSEHFDLAHVDSLDLVGYLPLLDSLPVVCVHHNVESQLLRRRATRERTAFRRKYLRHQAELLEKEERQHMDCVALNVAVSQEDRRELQRLAPQGRYTVVPNGVDCEYFNAAPGRAESVVFLGGTNWFPNRDALDYFCETILPILRSAGLSLPIRWIGRCTDAERSYFRKVHDLELTGYLDDIRPALQNAACCIVPLRVGGGTRLKIVTAWAAGKAMVSTSLGCEGLHVVDGQNILVRDDPEAFAKAMLQIIRNVDLRSRLEQGARRTAEEHYNWNVIGRRMRSEYLGLLKRPDAERSAREVVSEAVTGS